jgi:hypothetical protein
MQSELTGFEPPRQIPQRTRGEKPRGGVSFASHVTISRSNPDVFQETSIAPIRWRVDAIYRIDSVFGKAEFDIVKKWTLVGKPNA